MLSNPAWCQTASAWGQTVRQWVLLPTPETLLSLAIWMDAHAVCGDAGLLADVRHNVSGMLVGNTAVLGRFAATANAFADVGGGWWSRWLSLGDPGTQDAQQLDIKKAGTFPLVHGVRSLALEHGLAQTSTAARIQALVAHGVLAPDMGADLLDSLHFFMGLKLQAGLAEIAAGRPVTGGIAVDKLSSLDRDLLRTRWRWSNASRYCCASVFTWTCCECPGVTPGLVGGTQAPMAALPPG